MKTRSTLASMLLMLLVISFTPLFASDLWLHVRVDEDGEKVSVNIPLSVAERVLPLVEIDELRDGKLRLDAGDLDIEGIDLFELVAALGDAPDGDFVTVKTDDENVRVFKQDGYFRIDVEEDDEKVQVRIPVKIVEALVAGDPDELDIAAALRAMAEFAGEDFVTVESDDTSVRIWIDHDESGA